MLKTYTVKSKKSENTWEFKYDLNGNLKAFNILQGILTSIQVEWLFKKGNFPIKEATIREQWLSKLKKHFEIQIGDIDYSFEAWINFYGNKNGKPKMARNSFKKLSKADIINLYNGTDRYKHFLKYNPTRQMQDASTFINQESYLNPWKI